MQITLPIQFVKNIMFTGSLLIGVKSQLHVLGRTFGFPKLNNETGTSLILMTYMTFYITTSIEKYMPLLTLNLTKSLSQSLEKQSGRVKIPLLLHWTRSKLVGNKLLQRHWNQWPRLTQQYVNFLVDLKDRKEIFTMGNNG